MALPPPTTVGDFYLAAILDELKGLRADMARAPAADGPVEFREPEKVKAPARRKDPPEPKNLAGTRKRR